MTLQVLFMDTWCISRESAGKRWEIFSSSHIFFSFRYTCNIPWLRFYPCFFLSCKANARVQYVKTGHGPHSSKIFVLFYILFFCVVLRIVCVLYYCHRVATQFQLTNMYHIISYHIISYHNSVKKNQLDAQLILSIFRQPLHVSAVSRHIIRRYNRMYTTIGIYYTF